ncbi:Nudix hydrolase 17, mitochondrial [Senna tora]|uniref:Nudix hydrolase 17, mitochondrial n=1 Tax=Senna tora TaxID=362788 RepID=A0A835CIX9_9FABA|nr:Nudix hydrolase 17, mitochondrial [Senna tora]
MTSISHFSDVFSTIRSPCRSPTPFSSSPIRSLLSILTLNYQFDQSIFDSQIQSLPSIISSLFSPWEGAWELDESKKEVALQESVDEVGVKRHCWGCIGEMEFQEQMA